MEPLDYIKDCIICWGTDYDETTDHLVKELAEDFDIPEEKAMDMIYYVINTLNATEVNELGLMRFKLGVGNGRSN